MNHSYGFFGRNPAHLSEDEIVDRVASHALYPVVGLNGDVCFRSVAGVRLSSREVDFLISRFGLDKRDGCQSFRRRIRERRASVAGSRPIRMWVETERPRERLIKSGAASLSDSSLLAILLRTGSEGIHAEELGRRLLNRFGSLRGIDNADATEICSLNGIGPAKAAQIKAALEIGKRFSREKAEKTRRIRQPSDIVTYVAEYYGPYLRDSKKEIFSVIFLDIKNKPMRGIEVGRGSINASIVDPGEIIREASLRAASAVILVHNHPSGEAEPSDEDIRITGRIVEACSLVGVKVLDHVIIGKNLDDYYSFALAGLIK